MGNQYSFKKGHKLAKGGKREGAGRPSTRELKEIARAADRAREKLERKFGAITDCYTDLATDREHEATTRHAMENYVLPVAKEDGEARRPLQVTFLTFAVPNNTRLPLSPKDIPITVPRNAGGEQKSLVPAPHGVNVLLPAPEAKPPQVKFHEFASGNGKRRQ